MALYDPLTDDELRGLCKQFGLGMVSAEGVPQGSINTNYRLSCDQGRFFLRFTRARSAADLEFEAGLLAHLKGAGFPCPEPREAGDQRRFLGFRNGWVSIFGHLPGEELGPDAVTADHVGQIGRALGRLHRLGASYSGQRENPYGVTTVGNWFAELSKRDLEPEVRTAVERAGEALPRAAAALGLPRGPIHADLFRDNVKWLDRRISAVFDFEMACVDEYALDLGITLLVWTFGAETFDRPRVRALLEGYAAERRLLPEERQGLYARATFGAIRYTLSRIRDFHLAAAGPNVLAKKPWRRYAQRLDALEQLGAPRFNELCWG